MHKDYKQKIECAVTSCAYNSKGYNCSLDAIKVLPCEDCHSGKSDEESMCGSYRVRR
jgi:hypothetical protein